MAELEPTVSVVNSYAADSEAVCVILLSNVDLKIVRYFKWSISAGGHPHLSYRREADQSYSSIT